MTDKEQKRKEYLKAYYQAKKDKIKEQSKVYYENNKQKVIDYQKQYQKEYQKNDKRPKEYFNDYYENNKDKIKEQSKVYYENNKQKVINYQRKYQKNKAINNPLFKLTKNIRSLVKMSFKNNGFTKNSKTFLILGCTFDEFKTHLESQFESWMTWDNYGLYNGELNYGWDIDHIIPMKMGLNEEDVIKLNHYTNIKPLCSYTNRVLKKDKTQ